MKSSNNKTKLTASIAIVLLMTSAFMVMINAPVQAQLAEEQPVSGPLPDGITPDETFSPDAYLSFRPNPVGLNQIFLVNIWTTTPPAEQRKHSNYTVTITKPGGEEIVLVMDSYIDDGTNWFEYVADEVGEWKLKFDFLGTYFPPGRYYNGYIVTNTSGTLYPVSHYYNPASTAEQILTVQEDIVYSWPEAELPTDYWTRPVSPENREWWSIMGNYPWRGPGGGPIWDELYPDTNSYWSDSYDFTPWVQAPNTAHVVWKRQGAISGLTGAEQGIVSRTSGGGTPSIIYQGRAYDTYSKPGSGMSTQTYWQCYDIRTGELYWERPLESGESAPTVIEYSGTYASLLSISGGYLRKYDPWTGAMTLERSIAPLTGSGGTYYMNGYVLGVQNLGGGNYRLINWTTLGTTSNFASRVESNITWPWSSFGFAGGQQDFNAGVCVDIGWVRSGPRGTTYSGTRINASSFETGEALWDIYVDGRVMFNAGSNVADDGKVALAMDDGHFYAYDLDSGKLAWTSERLDYPWDAAGWGAYDIASAYGMIFRAAYSGVYAINWTDGSIVWKYEAPTPYEYETPYTTTDGITVYSFYGSSAVADGKLYIYNTEHSPTQPVTRGWRLHCINATTGEGIWNITGSMSPGAVADGYLTASNAYDGYMYVFGKGQSTTTVSAPDVAVPKGTAITIKGSVLDQSPAQPGAACVSKESMATYMEYLHMQKPIPDGYTVTGVPVMLLAFDSDGGVIDIGTTSTDMSGKFAYAWTPPDEGLYKITATFLGDDSYGSSWDETAVTVGPAPEEVDLSPLEGSVSNARTQIEDSIGSQTTYIIAILVLVIIALVIALYFGLKPRK